MFWSRRNLPSVELSGKLAGKSLTQQVLVLAMWPFLQNLLGTVVSFVDMAISGRMKADQVNQVAESTGDVAGAMVEMMGLVVYVAWLLMILQACVGTGAQAIVARAMGAKDRELGERAFAQAVILGCLAGCLAGLLVFFSAGLINLIPSMTDEAKQYGQQYIEILAISAPFSGIMFAVNSCLRASGDTLRPFYAMILVNVVNAFCSLLFVFGIGIFGSWLPDFILWAFGPSVLAWFDLVGGWGARGIAAGTVIGWAFGAMIVLYIARKKKARYQLNDPMILEPSYVRFDRKLSLRILRVAWPNTIEILGMWTCHAVGFFYVSELGRRFVESTGESGKGVILGAHALAIRVESLSFMPGFALGMAASTLAGQYLGAKSTVMAKVSVRTCWFYATVVMGAAGILMYLFAEPLVSLLRPGESQQKELAIQIIHIFAFAQPFFATAMVMKMSMRGAGATRTVMVYSFSTMILIRLMLFGWYVFYSDLEPTLQGAWVIMTSDLLIQALVFCFIHFRGKWTLAKV